MTTSLSSALSKNVPAYFKMSSGLSSRILRIKSAIRPFSSGCDRKYSSFCMRSSSYQKKQIPSVTTSLSIMQVTTYLFLFDLIFLGRNDSFNTDKVMIVDKGCLLFFVFIFFLFFLCVISGRWLLRFLKFNLLSFSFRLLLRLVVLLFDGCCFGHSKMRSLFKLILL